MGPTENDLLQLVAECCGEPSLEPDEELLESGLLDSFGVIALLTALEDRYGLELYLTQIPPEILSTPRSIAGMTLREWERTH